MNIKDFDFDLPDNLIAQTPLKDRTSSRLLILNKETQEIKHEKFSGLKSYLKKGDCLLLNDTRVLPARLYGVKLDTGAKIEVLLLHQEEKDYWEALVKPAKKVKVGTTLSFGEGQLQAKCVGMKERGGRLFQFSYQGIFYEVLEQLGKMPLPPYIKTELQEKDRYQTVYAKEDGSAAAPTAGLHFTKDLIEEIKALGVTVAYITLHVGLGTFRPVQVDTIEDHKMHSENYLMSPETAKVLTETKNRQGRIITVGTTSTRVLETIAKNNDGGFVPASGWTDLFVYPPYEFQAVDAMLTNFHLPKSTLIMLVCAFGGKSNVMQAYEEAVKNNYRFFSFGDAMLIL